MEKMKDWSTDLKFEDLLVWELEYRIKTTMKTKMVGAMNMVTDYFSIKLGLDYLNFCV